MKKLIQYDAFLIWGKLLKPTPKEMVAIINDINAFHPTIHIGTISTEVHFSIVYANDSPHINVCFSIRKEALDEGDGVDEGSLMFVDGIVVDRLKDVLFAINLAYPGHIHVFRGILNRDGNPVKEFAFSTDLSGLAFQDCKWIPFEQLTIQQCWDWICTKTNFLNGVSKTPIDRALHALSYESVANEDMYIFYIMLGLEAIYNNNSNNEESISAQMRRKIQFMLGELTPNTIKAINAMYKRRSSLVHGNANIFKCWGSDDCSESEAEMMEREREYIVTATGILLATIQKFIKANANVIKESLVVSLESE